ncbi:MAG TPA: hypothetical protein VF250_08310 [Conexibacter sp.]
MGAGRERRAPAHDGDGPATVEQSLVQRDPAGAVEAGVVLHATRRTVASAPMSANQELAIGSVLLGVPLLLFTQLIALWPSALAATTTPRSMPTMVWLFGAARMELSPDGALLLLVAMVGALGACAASSFRFAMFAGSDALSRRWMWSYVLRPVQGAMLATIVYFVLRAGLLGGDGTQPLSAYGLAAVAGLVGLFTRQGFQKLRRVFNELWGVDDPDANLDPDPDVPLRREAHRKPRTDGGAPAPPPPARRRPPARTNGRPPASTNGGRPAARRHAAARRPAARHARRR